MATGNDIIEDPLAPTNDLGGGVGDISDLYQSGQQNPYEHYEVLKIHQCVSHYDEPDAPMSYFVYGAVIGFETAEDHNAYLNHPERSEIESTIKDRVASENEETLRFEINRDEDKDTYPNAGHDSFNGEIFDGEVGGTIGDFSVTFDTLIPEINQDYGTNIQGGFVAEQSAELPGALFCHGSQPLPDDVTQNHDGGNGQTYAALKM